MPSAYVIIEIIYTDGDSDDAIDLIQGVLGDPFFQYELPSSVRYLNESQDIGRARYTNRSKTLAQMPSTLPHVSCEAGLFYGNDFLPVDIPVQNAGTDLSLCGTPWGPLPALYGTFVAILETS